MAVAARLKRVAKEVRDLWQQRWISLLGVLSYEDLEALAGETEDEEKAQWLESICTEAFKERWTPYQLSEKLYPLPEEPQPDPLANVPEPIEPVPVMIVKPESPMVQERQREARAILASGERRPALEPDLNGPPVMAQYLGWKANGSFSIETTEGRQRVFRNKVYELPSYVWANLQQNEHPADRWQKVGG